MIICVIDGTRDLIFVDRNSGLKHTRNSFVATSGENLIFDFVNMPTRCLFANWAHSAV